MSLLPLVIVNPASAGGATRERWAGVAADLRAHFGPFECAFTTVAGDGCRIAEREARVGRPLLIACGGDGTIAEVANGILASGNQDAELGVLPSGTGGDFRRSLNIPSRAADAALALARGRTKRMDVGRVTCLDGDGEEKSRYFVNVVSFGMGGEVVRRVKRGGGGGKWLPLASASSSLVGGKAAFAIAALRTVLSSEGVELSLRFDDEAEQRLKVANVSVANARYIGGGMKIAPQAVLDDNLLDVIVVGDIGALEILANAPKLYRGTHLGVPQVAHRRVRSLHARSVDAGARKIIVEVDGELVGHLPAQFEVVPGALRVRCPI